MHPYTPPCSNIYRTLVRDLARYKASILRDRRSTLLDLNAANTVEDKVGRYLPSDIARRLSISNR